jgi:hypothetical protein
MTDSSDRAALADDLGVQLMAPELVLQAARELRRYYANPNQKKPYTAGVIGDCIATIETLQAQLTALRTPSVSEADGREAIAKLIRTAQLLQQNSVGCAVRHHFLDIEKDGLPGWLRDTQNAIDNAILALPTK